MDYWELDKERKRVRNEIRRHLRESNKRQRQIDRRQMQHSIGIRYGWLLRCLEKIGNFLYENVSVITWLTRCKPEWERSYSLVENFVVICVAVESAFFLSLLRVQSLGACDLFIWIVAFLLGYRLLDIIQYWFHAHILYREPISSPRTLVLSMINFFEIIIIFAVLDYLARDSFDNGFLSVKQSLYYSIRTITTMGADVSPSSCLGYFLFYFEIFCGVIFLIVIVGLIISYFRERKA